MIDVRKVFNKKYLIFFTADMSRFSFPMYPLIKTSSSANYPSRPFSFQYTCLSAKSGWILGNMGRKVKGKSFPYSPYPPLIIILIFVMVRIPKPGLRDKRFKELARFLSFL